MAKKSKIVREYKLMEKVQKYSAIRAELKSIIKDPNSSADDKRNAVSKLDRLPNLLVKFALEIDASKLGDLGV